MHEHYHHTEFLKKCLRYDESAGGRELEQAITRLQREERCVRRAAWLMADLTALAAAALAYPAIIFGNFPYCVPEFLLVVLCTLGGASLLSLITFVGMGVFCRLKLDNRRKECRLKLIRLLESRLGGPAATPSPELPGTPMSFEAGEAAPVGSGSASRTASSEPV
jgi:hypothetical protein